MPLTTEEQGRFQRALEQRLRDKAMPTGAIRLVWGMIEESLPKETERIEVVSSVPAFSIQGMELIRKGRR